MASTNFVSIPEGLLTKRQRKALLGEQPASVPELIDGKQLSAALTVSERTIDSWKRDRLIPFIKVGHIVRFDLTAVRQALERHVVPSK